jgi:hypothetical protein
MMNDAIEGLLKHEMIESIEAYIKFKIKQKNKHENKRSRD